MAAILSAVEFRPIDPVDHARHCILKKDRAAFDLFCSDLVSKPHHQNNLLFRRFANDCVREKWAEGIQVMVDNVHPNLFPHVWDHQAYLSQTHASPFVHAVVVGSLPIVKILVSHCPTEHLLYAAISAVEQDKEDMGEFLHLLLDHCDPTILRKPDLKTVAMLLIEAAAHKNENYLDRLVKIFSPLVAFCDWDQAFFRETPGNRPVFNDKKALARWDRIWNCVTPAHRKDDPDLYDNLFDLFNHPDMLKFCPLTQAKHQKSAITKEIGFKHTDTKSRKI